MISQPSASDPERGATHPRLAPAWLLALALVTLAWIGWGRFPLSPLVGDLVPWWPLLMVGLNVIAAVGLFRGGVTGRVLAAFVALMGVVPVIAGSVVMALWAATDPHGTTFSLTDEVAGLPTWAFAGFVVAIVAGYGLVLIRAIRGR